MERVLVCLYSGDSYTANLIGKYFICALDSLYSGNLNVDFCIYLIGFNVRSYS